MHDVVSKHAHEHATVVAVLLLRRVVGGRFNHPLVLLCLSHHRPFLLPHLVDEVLFHGASVLGPRITQRVAVLDFFLLYICDNQRPVAAVDIDREKYFVLFKNVCAYISSVCCVCVIVCRAYRLIKCVTS